MTPPTQTSPAGDKRFVRDVAKQVDRRRMRRKATLWTALLALVAAAVAYLRCGGGFGLGTGTGGEAGPSTPQTVAAPRRCAIRVTATGIVVNGVPMQRDQAVDACKATTGADVIVTGDAREGDWADLRTALTAAGVADVVVHQPPPGSGAN
jgi:hypothetical protein